MTTIFAVYRNRCQAEGWQETEEGYQAFRYQVLTGRRDRKGMMIWS